DVERLLAAFREQQVDGVLVDLRNNGGGSLNEAIELTGLFIETGPVVQVREAGGRVSVESDRSRTVAWDGPLAVLVNRASASASEIFAAAIQDYGRGLIIGEPTYGKGTVQNLIDLDRFQRSETPRYGQVKLTVAQFFRISGGSTQHKGVVPDISFPITLDAEEFGESSYDNALPWTRIPAASFARQGEFAALLPLLESRHRERIASDVEFRWWSEDVARYREQRIRKEISLHEATRRAEREADEARRKSREEERVAAGLDAPSIDGNADDGLNASERGIAEMVAEVEREQADERPDALAREAAAILADALNTLKADTQLAAQVHANGERREGAWVGLID
ncbi:MAG TPA: tail-specific protease, partial [Xanthomonadales bacterium]|nr:tail-specific protease [Xanthomonadales bacterium]